MLRTDPTVVFDRRRLAWGLLRLIGLVGVVVLAISSVPGLAGLRARLAGADTGWVVSTAVLEVGSVACFVVALRSALAERLRWRAAAAIGTTAQGVNVLVPAGGTGGLAAAGVIMTRAGIPAGFAATRLIALFLLSSVATNVLLVIVAGLGVWAGILPGNASPAASLLPALAALAIVAALAVLLRRAPRAPRPARLRRWRSIALRALDYLRDGAACSGRLLRTGDPRLVLGALGFVLLDLAALDGAFHAVGAAALPAGSMLLAYTLGQAGSIVSLPGTTEGGLVGVFLLYGAPLVPATSAILVYRAAQSLVPLALGLLGALELRRVLNAPAALSAADAEDDGRDFCPAPAPPP
ncbi:MAG: flippase-like domain-containing protein [Solirubrobacterales bacterium]|nr:flippase-like domain-containing protein [Solirubrobacterales bacterium]